MQDKDSFSMKPTIRDLAEFGATREIAHFEFGNSIKNESEKQADSTR